MVEIVTHATSMFRYENYIGKNSFFKQGIWNIFCFSPTENAANFHLFRVNLHCIIFKNLDMSDAMPWGW